MKTPDLLCIIPARSGSKSFPHKNITPFLNLPLLVHSIQHAKTCSYPMRVIVSTDSEEYASIARSYGAETPFLRPPEISGDLSTDLECMLHCAQWLQINESYVPPVIVQLRPTYPTRTPKILTDCIETFLTNYDQYDSLRTVVPFEKSPYKMYRIQKNQLQPLFTEVDGIQEPYNRCRQELPETFLHNGCVDIFKTELLLRPTPTVTGERIYPYIMHPTETHDVDTPEDLEKCKSE